MNICMVLAGIDFPPDTRVYKEARSLISAGHRIILLCSRTGDSPVTSLWNGIEIRRIAPLPFLFRKLNSIIYVVFMRDLQWKRAIRRLIERKDIRAIHVHDLPMVGTALSAAKRMGLPVIADLHEHYAIVRRINLATQRVRFVERLMWPARWERAERRWGRRCAFVVAVVREMKERLVSSGIPPHSIIVVENTVDADYFLSLGVRNEIVAHYQGEFVISYIGHFSDRRGLDTAIQAMPHVLKEIPNARLLLIGWGPNWDRLQALARTVGVENKVTFIDKVDFSLVPSYIALSEVCLLPLKSTPQTEASAPNKLFHYMLMAKPVVSSSMRSLRRFLEDGKLGMLFTPEDSDSLADAILKLKDPAVRKKLGEAGRKAALGKYNWQKTSRKLLALYQSLPSRQDSFKLPAMPAVSELQETLKL